MRRVRIYLDHCVYNRPFDDKTQLSVRLEITAVLAIMTAIRSDVFELVWSFMNEYENNDNPFDKRKEVIFLWEYSAAVICKPDREILNKSLEIQQNNIKPKDSLHLACAVKTRCDYFITTDISLLKKKTKVKEVKIVSPIEFISIMEKQNASENET